MAYLRNCWYMASWSADIPAAGVLARTLLDEPVVLLRGEDGMVLALADQCPHRFAPLSMGQVRGNGIACAYHGLAFGAGGACIANPHGPITRAMAVRAYPVAEAHRAIWVWMGDPALADPALVRDLGFMDAAPDTAFSAGYLRGSANYQLFVDNVLDLTHTDTLHPSTLGGGAITRTRATVGEEAGIVSIKWNCVNEVPPPLLAQRLPPGVDRVDSWVEVAWSAPGVMSLVSGAVPVGQPRAGAPNSTNVHILTPETATTCHYFFAATRDFKLDDAALNDATAKIRHQIFSTEDEPMIQGQQARMRDREFWSMRPILLRTDEGAVRVRRRMEALIAAEAAAQPAVGAAG